MSWPLYSLLLLPVTLHRNFCHENVVDKFYYQCLLINTFYKGLTYFDTSPPIGIIFGSRKFVWLFGCDSRVCVFFPDDSDIVWSSRWRYGMVSEGYLPSGHIDTLFPLLFSRRLYTMPWRIITYSLVPVELFFVVLFASSRAFHSCIFPYNDSIVCVVFNEVSVTCIHMGDSVR